jgi:hypothetical protein
VRGEHILDELLGKRDVCPPSLDGSEVIIAKFEGALKDLL